VITIALLSMNGEELTTADLGWFCDAVNGASGHSGKDYTILLEGSSITVEIESGGK
jgi:hypothetical protein